MKNILVADIMTRNPICVSPETNLLKCAKIMVKKRTGSLLLVKKNILFGILSRKDILWAVVKSKEKISRIRAIDISPRKIATIKPHRTLEYAFKKMKKVKFARLPVIYEGRLVGLITIKDIFRYNQNIFPEMMDYTPIREWKDKEKRLERAKTRAVMEGLCNECGNHGILVDFHGVLMCESCADSM